MATTRFKSKSGTPPFLVKSSQSQVKFIFSKSSQIYSATTYIYYNNKYIKTNNIQFEHSIIMESWIRQCYVLADVPGVCGLFWAPGWEVYGGLSQPVHHRTTRQHQETPEKTWTVTSSTSINSARWVSFTKHGTPIPPSLDLNSYELNQHQLSQVSLVYQT